MSNAQYRLINSAQRLLARGDIKPPSTSTILRLIKDGSVRGGRQSVEKIKGYTGWRTAMYHVHYYDLLVYCCRRDDNQGLVDELVESGVAYDTARRRIQRYRRDCMSTADIKRRLTPNAL